MTEFTQLAENPPKIRGTIVTELSARLRCGVVCLTLNADLSKPGEVTRVTRTLEQILPEGALLLWPPTIPPARLALNIGFAHPLFSRPDSKSWHVRGIGPYWALVAEQKARFAGERDWRELLATVENTANFETDQPKGP